MSQYLAHIYNFICVCQLAIPFQRVGFQFTVKIRIVYKSLKFVLCSFHNFRLWSFRLKYENQVRGFQKFSFDNLLPSSIIWRFPKRRREFLNLRSISLRRAGSLPDWKGKGQYLLLRVPVNNWKRKTKACSRFLWKMRIKYVMYVKIRKMIWN